MAANLVHVVRTKGLCILRQLRLEEALLRTNAGNWCIINDGAPDPSVVMGISGKPHALVDISAAHRDGVTVIKRFSGGGTVVVDADTQFVSFILNAEATPDLQLFPVPLMQWTGELYGGVEGGVFADVPGFRLRENDYVVGDKKVGGNAQSISKGRWLHHTSFLWDFREEMMQYLKHPAKTPAYREGRTHLDFLTPLCTVLPSRDTLPDRVAPALRAMTVSASLEEAEAAISGLEHHRTTAVVDLEAALEAGADARAPTLPNPPIVGVTQGCRAFSGRASESMQGERTVYF